MFAEPGSGEGTWLTHWSPTDKSSSQNDNVILEVPRESVSVGQHQATIEWTLHNVPEK